MYWRIDLIAAQKDKYRVRHFGGVLTFRVVGGEIVILAVSDCVPGARSARFSKDLDFLALENAKFCSPAGASAWGLARIGFWLSKDWNDYWRLTPSLSIGEID